MPFNGSGQYSAPANSWNPAVGATSISSSDWNATQSDYETALSNVICKDGQTTLTANIPWSGFKATGVNTNSGSTSRSEWVSGATYQDGAPIDAGDTAGTSTAYTATLTPAISAYADKQCFRIKLNATCGASPTINFNSVGAKKLYLFEGTTEVQPAAGELIDNDVLIIRYDASLDSAAGGFLITNIGPRATQAAAEAGTDNSTYMTPLRTAQAISSLVSVVTVPVRQTILSGPVDSDGLPNFGGSTGSSTVTMSGTLIATAANGFTATGGGIDVLGTGTNLSWTGLTTNGTMYLYVDIAAGALTAGATTLKPTYQWGGTYSTTSGQFTFNIQEMVGKVGNGSTADQTYRVFVGQVTVASNVVSVIRWYALMGRYEGAFTATLPSANTVVTGNHNIGVKDIVSCFEIECTTAEQDYSIGDRVQIQGSYSASSGIALPLVFRYNETISSLRTMSSQAVTLINSSGNSFPATAANWKYRFVATRRW